MPTTIVPAYSSGPIVSSFSHPGISFESRSGLLNRFHTRSRGADKVISPAIFMAIGQATIRKRCDRSSRLCARDRLLQRPACVDAREFGSEVGRGVDIRQRVDTVGGVRRGVLDRGG